MPSLGGFMVFDSVEVRCLRQDLNLHGLPATGSLVRRVCLSATQACCLGRVVWGEGLEPPTTCL